MSPAQELASLTAIKLLELSSEKFPSLSGQNTCIEQVESNGEEKLIFIACMLVCSHKLTINCGSSCTGVNKPSISSCYL